MSGKHPELEIWDRLQGIADNWQADEARRLVASLWFVMSLQCEGVLAIAEEDVRTRLEFRIAKFLDPKQWKELATFKDRVIAELEGQPTEAERNHSAELLKDVIQRSAILQGDFAEKNPREP
jgi:hypothetical protein